MDYTNLIKYATLFNGEVERILKELFTKVKEEAVKILPEVKSLLEQDEIIVEDKRMTCEEVQTFIDFLEDNIINADFCEISTSNINDYLLLNWNAFYSIYQEFYFINTYLSICKINIEELGDM